MAVTAWETVDNITQPGNPRAVPGVVVNGASTPTGPTTGRGYPRS